MKPHIGLKSRYWLGAVLSGALLVTVPADGVRVGGHAAAESLAQLLGMRSPGKRPAGALSDKLRRSRVEPAIAEPPPALPDETPLADVLPEEDLTVVDVELPDELALAEVKLPPVPQTVVPARYASRVPYPSPSSAVPEPATWLSLCVGFGAIGALLRRRRKTATGARAGPASDG